MKATNTANIERVTVKSTTLEEVTEKVFDIEDKCEDFFSPKLGGGNSNVSYEQDKFFLNYTDINGTEHRSPLTRHSLRQLCSLIDVPTRYAEKCAGVHEDWATNLILQNMNEWLLRNKRENALIREYDKSVRGILSDRYTTFDAPDVMLGVNTGFSQFHDDYSVEGYTVNPEMLHIRVVKKSPVPGLNEDLYAGVVISSSDVGRGSISIGYFLFKQICTNGLIVRRAAGTRFRQVHMGNIDEIAFAVETAIAGIADYERNVSEYVKKGRKINLTHILKNPDSSDYEALFRNVKAHTGLPSKAVEQVFDVAMVGYEPTMWGIVNAITDQAQSYTLDRRLILEEAAGRLLVSA